MRDVDDYDDHEGKTVPKFRREHVSKINGGLAWKKFFENSVFGAISSVDSGNESTGDAANNG